MSLPITQQQAIKAGNWLQNNFCEQVNNAINGTQWTLPIIQGIFCQETAYKVLYWIDNYKPDVILGRCVFDLSGEPEFPNNPRAAFPRNRNDFKAHFGGIFLNDLVQEYNLTRAMPQPNFPKGYQATDTPFLAKAYGLFQYDLQNITTDRIFFEQKLWYSFDACLDRLIKELNEKAALKRDMHGTIAAYNGGGIAAQQYADNVLTMSQYFA